MNSKRAKAIRRLANECGIGYRPMKQQYNKFARQSEQENKLYAKVVELAKKE